jgi:anti-sigma factor RsiW
MNESRFIELLNLYVDQQLSGSEAAELELEIKTNPLRHRTYRQYCRMQKACTQIFEHERTSAPASIALARAMVDAERKVTASPARAVRRPVWSTGLSFAGLAAAACVAIVLIQRSERIDQADKGVVVTAKPAVSLETAQSVASNQRVGAIPVRAAADDFKPIFATHSLGSPSAADLFLAPAVKENSTLLDWTQQVQLQPVRQVSVEDFVFDPRAKQDKAMTAGFAPADSQPAEEMTVITFER